MLEIITDTLLDSLKLLPFLFISYLVIEYIEHKSTKKLENVLSTSGKYSKLAGSLLGAIPQCGFSAIAANLFSNRVITMGTLISVFLATSDEAIPILLTYPEKGKSILIILAIKIIIGFLAGTIIDKILVSKDKEKGNFNSQDMHEHMHDTCKHCDCEHSLILSSIKHTLSIFVFLIIISFVINIAVELIGQNNFEKIILSGSILQPFVASIIGLIPNCAASVMLTRLYVEGALSLGSIIAGLSTGAGVGTIVLFKTNKNMKENIKIVGLVYIIGALCGILIDVVLMVI